MSFCHNSATRSEAYDAGQTPNFMASSGKVNWASILDEYASKPKAPRPIKWLLPGSSAISQNNEYGWIG
jgi:hypothetical protein